uniref:Uncharacterized protein n=1 Tax=Amphimedon queenslandica TaxID=400682 RepID=A0A1X7VTJ1_AMPQE
MVITVGPNLLLFLVPLSNDKGFLLPFLGTGHLPNANKYEFFVTDVQSHGCLGNRLVIVVVDVCVRRMLELRNGERRQDMERVMTMTMPMTMMMSDDDNDDGDNDDDGSDDDDDDNQQETQQHVDCSCQWNE